MNTVNPISGGSPPIYPGTTELAAGGWQQQHQVDVNDVYSPQGAQTLVAPNAPQGYHEVHGQAARPLQPQEMFAGPQTAGELYSEAYAGGVHEMSAKKGS